MESISSKSSLLSNFCLSCTVELVATQWKSVANYYTNNCAGHSESHARSSDIISMELREILLLVVAHLRGYNGEFNPSLSYRYPEKLPHRYNQAFLYSEILWFIWKEIPLNHKKCTRIKSWCFYQVLSSLLEILEIKINRKIVEKLIFRENENSLMKIDFSSSLDILFRQNINLFA